MNLFTLSWLGHFTRDLQVAVVWHMSVLNLSIYYVSMHLIETGQMISIFLSWKMTHYMPS